MNAKKPVLANRRVTKDVYFCGSSLDDLRCFPEDAQDRVGYALHLVQCGMSPPDFKQMKTIGDDVMEIRVRDSAGEYGVFYLATLPTSVYVLHAFVKKTQKTSDRDIRLGQRRYKDLMKLLEAKP